MNELRVVLAFLVLAVGLSLVVTERPPIFRWGYEVANLRGYGKPGRAY